MAADDPIADIRGSAQNGSMSASRLSGGILLIFVGCAWIYIAATGQPRLQIGVANGSYFNRCCGTLHIKNGQMTAGGQRISYVIERDKIGRYVLPQMYVGASGTEFVVKPEGYALKLRLDDQPHPNRIQLLDDRPNGASYSFKRISGS